MTNHVYGPDTLESKRTSLLDLAVETSFDELNYALDAICHAKGIPPPYQVLGPLEDVEGLVELIKQFWDKTPGWLDTILHNNPLTRLPAGITNVQSTVLSKIREVALGKLKAEFSDDVRAYYKPHIDRISDYIRPYPTFWSSIVDQIDKAKLKLGDPDIAFDEASGEVTVGSLDSGTISTGLEIAQECAGEWEGAFADELRFDYVIPLKTAILPNAMIALYSFRAYSESLHNLAIAKRRQLSGIIDHAEDALNDLKAGDPQDDLKKFLYVSSAVIAIASAGTGAAGAAVSGQLVSVGLAAAEKYLPDDPADSETDFGSGFPAHVVAKIGTALTELENNYKVQIDKIAGSMATTAADISAAVKADVLANRLGTFTLQTPQIVDATGSQLLAPDNLVPD